VGISLDELQLAARNHGMPLEALRWDVTPVGLHYLLIHYDIPAVDADAWRLELGGRVDRPLSLSLADLRSRAQTELVATMECAGNGRARIEPRAISQPWLLEAVGTGRWGGIPLAALLAEAEPQTGAVDVVFTGLDGGVEGGVEQRFQRALPLADALGGEALLALDLNGAPLPPQHGFPLRLVVPGWYGMTNVKWLARIDVLDHAFDGYQQTTGYHFRRSEDDDGVPLSRMAPRALMLPPGEPDFLTRERFLTAAPTVLEGRAWSGGGEVTAVEVTCDGGATWHPAELDAPLGRWAWRRWTFAWKSPAPGHHVLGCRATDETGAVQPVVPEWNVGGYANNAVQRVLVTVRAAA
jgi:DMSO/TMAO reductase YedYZ molybdopterin-dependent catalytic subunit